MHDIWKIVSVRNMDLRDRRFAWHFGNAPERRAWAVNERLTIFGSGNWGLALADQASRSMAQVMVYVRRRELQQFLTTRRQHPDYLRHLTFSSQVSFTNDLEEAARFSPYWVLAVPSQHMRDIGQRLEPWIPVARYAVSAAKGLEVGTDRRMTEVLRECWHGAKVELGVLSGPNLAGEISQGQPAASVLAGSPALFKSMANILGQGNLRLYGQRDIVGVELGGAFKNILAIAVGIAVESGLGDNAQAAIMTRGLHEMGRLAVRMGARWETLAGLSGLGDVVATSNSPSSRNRWFGQELAKGRSVDAILGSTPMVVEGVPTAYAARDLGQKFGLPVPITTEVVEIFNGKSVKLAVEALMSRQRVEESDR
ncbi:glycerol-3-phosphate dehydrogenase [Sulfobacillus sp. hq2]|nr:glycerol-3-phosphate dehydrogenase [Sulfobacillus sp. hq2]